MSDLVFSAQSTEAGDFERVAIVHQSPLACDEDLDELDGLARAAGGTVCVRMLSRRGKPVAGSFLGKGKMQELAELVSSEDISLVVVDQELSPIQERNLERTLRCRVIDRTRLILDIFALRASTSEGKLQVELAQLRHMSTRLVRGWTHLERQKGGIGLRGPGETQLESDRRLLGNRIRVLRRRLEKVEAQRKLRRRSRERTPVPVVSLVGYTNAGKSSLFNALTGAGVYAEDKLFATLDPTMRRFKPEGAEEVVLSDTVGFISRLPHNLVKAFHSTLEEVAGSNLLLHVIDFSDPDWRSRKEEVELVLKEIEADEIPRFEIYNKIDVAGSCPERVSVGEVVVEKIHLSAESGEGLDLLNNALGAFFSRSYQVRHLSLPVAAGRIRAQLYERCRVLSESYDESGNLEMEVEMAIRDIGWLEHQPGFEPGFWLECAGSG